MLWAAAEASRCHAPMGQGQEVGIQPASIHVLVFEGSIGHTAKEDRCEWAMRSSNSAHSVKTVAFPLD